MSVIALPRFAVFKNKYNSKYLSYRKDDKYLIFNGEDVSSLSSKFAIESASNGNGLVHLRCCYNNKYFVRNSSQFAVAEAAKPDEDTSTDTCTLFEPIALDDDADKQTIRFRHVFSGTYACLFNAPKDHRNASLCAMWTSPNGSLMDAYEVINWNSLVIFPSHAIAFKGSNGSYLGGVWAEKHQYQQFSVDDKNSNRAAYEVHPVGDGNVQIYCRYFTRYLTFNDSWIWADRLEATPNDRNALFSPIKLGDNVIALRSLGNNKILRGLDADGKTRCLNAWETTLSNVTNITVEELVISRSIYDITYRQEDARVYNDNPIMCGTGTAVNNTDQEDTMTIPINYREAKSTSWVNSISLSASVTTSIEVRVPLIEKGKIDFNVTATGGHQWGGTVDASFETGVTYTAKIAPRKQVKVTYVASKGTCDVPFSYFQEDLYSDGTRKITLRDDGMFTGVNCYNYAFHKEETDIEQPTNQQQLNNRSMIICMLLVCLLFLIMFIVCLVICRFVNY